MDDEKLIIMDNFLKSHGSSFETLSKNKKIQFEKTYDALIQRKEYYENARSELKNNKITVASIADDTGIARKTFYNNPLLKLLVNEFANSVSNPLSEKGYAKAKEQINNLSKQVKLMSIRDSETEALRHENDDLKREITEKDIRIHDLETQLEKMYENSNDDDEMHKLIPFNRN